MFGHLPSIGRVLFDRVLQDDIKEGCISDLEGVDAAACNGFCTSCLY